MAHGLMAEDQELFDTHAYTNDVVHVFRRVDSDELVGFQFWRTAPMTLPGCRAILGGKLRIAPAVRGRGLHLLSGLLFFLQSKRRRPLTRFYRLSIASLFGFVSITESLRHYQVFDPHDLSPEGRAITAAFIDLATDNHCRLDLNTGLVTADIHITQDTVRQYGQAYFERPAAQRYINLNPGYYEDGSFLSFWYRFSAANLTAIVRTITRKMWRKGRR